MLRLREMRSALEKAKTQGVSMQRRLVLYWFSMALAILAAVLLVVSLTGMFSNTAQKLGQSLSIQERNTASALAGQMDQLTAQSIALSEELTRELDKQLAAGGRTFSALNDDPRAIALVETALYPALNTYLKSGACSGAVFCLMPRPTRRCRARRPRARGCTCAIQRCAPSVRRTSTSRAFAARRRRRAARRCRCTTAGIRS